MAPALSPAPAPEVETTPFVVETGAPVFAAEPMPGMLDAIESTPVMESFHDLAPVAAESQRTSGDVVGGSHIEQVVTKIAWDQTAHAVEHSSGTAPAGGLASAASASYPPDPRFDDPFAAIPAAELAVASEASAYAVATEQAPAAVVEEVASAISVAEAYPPASRGAATSYEKRASAAVNSMLPVFYILGPLAILVSAAGVGLIVWSMFMRVARRSGRPGQARFPRDHAHADFARRDGVSWGAVIIRLRRAGLRCRRDSRRKQKLTGSSMQTALGEDAIKIIG